MFEQGMAWPELCLVGYISCPDWKQVGDCYTIARGGTAVSLGPQPERAPTVLLLLPTLPSCLTMGIGTRRLYRGQLKSIVPVEPLW